MTTKIQPQYIYPPRPRTAIPKDQLAIFGENGWIAQLKYNGARCLIKYLPDGNIELWSRHAERFKTYTAPNWLLDELRDLQTALGLSTSEWSLLDAELLDFKHEAIRDTLAIFDILVENGNYLVGTTYAERIAKIYKPASGIWYYHPPHKKHDPINFGHKLNEHLLTPSNYPIEAWDGLWATIALINQPYLDVGKGPVIEGLVGKDPHGELTRAFKEQNNSEWMVRSRVTTGRHKF